MGGKEERGWKVERRTGKQERESSLGEEAGDQASWSGLLSVTRRYPWGSHTDLVATAGTVVPPRK